jgi:hypothetical protein
MHVVNAEQITARGTAIALKERHAVAVRTAKQSRTRTRSADVPRVWC